MTSRGKLVLTFIILAVVGVGMWKWWEKLSGSSTPTTTTTTTASSGSTPGAAPADTSPPVALAETQTEIPKLAPPGTYQPKDNVVEIELSEYAGYAGLIVANGGLEPNDNSIFAKKHGFKV